MCSNVRIEEHGVQQAKLIRWKWGGQKKIAVEWMQAQEEVYVMPISVHGCMKKQTKGGEKDVIQ